MPAYQPGVWQPGDLGPDPFAPPPPASTLYPWGQGKGTMMPSNDIRGYYALGPGGQNGEPVFMPWSATNLPRIMQNSTGELGGVGDSWQYEPQDLYTKWTGPDEGLLQGFLSSIGDSLSEPYLPMMLAFGGAALGGASGPGDWFSGGDAPWGVNAAKESATGG